MSEKIEIPAEKLHEEMLKLRQGKHMDFLRSLTGMDWGEEGLGVVYHLEDKIGRASCRERVCQYV